jgi:hypothetical protein
VKNFSDILKCRGCGKTAMRKDTLILQTSKKSLRICRDCYAAYEENKLDDDYKETKKNIKLYNLRDIDAYETIKKREKFVKNIREGMYG